jgi:signal transduction histidine kinase
MITFVIEDNGMGIDPKYLDALFTKFGFVKDSVRSNHPNTESTGLGLYICKAIVEMHGGKIWAKSAGREKGSTFAFTIPIYTEQLYKQMTKEYVKERDAGLLHNSVD